MEPLTLFLPGLLGPVSDELQADGLPEADALAGLLAAARRRAAQPDPFWRLAAGFGMKIDPPGSNEPPPIAALSYLADFGAPPPQSCFRCDPVHLQADMSQALLYDSRSFDISAQEAEQLTAAFNRHFADDKLQLVFRDARRWFLLADNPPPLHAPVPDEVVGRNAGAFLPKKPGARYWNRVLNEAQMLFFGHDVNLQRESRGEPPVNGVWIYGGGRVTGAGPAVFDEAYSDDAFCKGLALQSGTSVRPWADIFATDFWQSQGRVLLFNNGLRDALLVGDSGRWASLLAEWEARLFIPLRQQWRAGKLGRVTIDPDDGYEYGIAPRGYANRFLGVFRSVFHGLGGKRNRLAAFIHKNQTGKNIRP